VVTYERALPYFELAASGGSLDRRRALLALNAHALSTLATVNFLLHNFWRAAVLYETALMLHHQLDHVDDDAGSSSRSDVCPEKVSPLTFCNNNRKSAPI